MKRCIKCGEPIAEIPIYTYREGKKYILWKNLFKMSIESVALIVIVIVMVIAYKYDTAVCRDILEHPIKFCNESNACKVLEERSNPFITEPTPILFPFQNESGGIP